MAEPLVLVDDQDDDHPGSAQFPRERDGLVEFGPLRGPVEIFSEKTPVASNWVGVEGRGGPWRRGHSHP